MPPHLARFLRQSTGVEEGNRAVQVRVAGLKALAAAALYGATGASHVDFTRPAEYTLAART